MTPDIQRAALRAAAKLALPAFLFACGSTASPPANDDSSTTSSSESDLSAATCSKKVDRYCAAEHPYETQVECCSDEVATADFPKDPPFSTKPDPNVDALTRGCCTVLAQAADTDPSTKWPRFSCCAAIGWDATGSCTPWGPPVPPAMKRLVA
jgi:hypothetical protein